MNIYSIKEILKATNNFLDPNNKSEIKKNIKISKKKKSLNNKNIIRKKEKTHISEKINSKNTKIPLVLENEIPASNTINLYNYKIKIKPEVRDHMINELFIYLKKKIKKNTLKLIIEEQLEKKNLINKINFLKQKENQLKIDYLALKNIYELSLENNKILKIDNNNLRNNLDQASITKEQLDIENKKLRINLKEQEANLEVSLEKNKSFEINNSELKNTISRYIVNYKKLQEKVTLLENSKNLELEDEIKKVKFYQDENIRLSSELLLVRKKNETIKVNLNDIELEKQKISNKIKELSNTITGKSNVISPNIIKEIPGEAQKDIKKLNDKEHKNLDEVINRIFNKI